jgi:hypothetical protein
VEGAALNVAINLPSVPAGERGALEARARQATEKAATLHAEVVDRVRARMGLAAGA